MELKKKVFDDDPDQILHHAAKLRNGSKQFQ